jgi:hypothetical protein
MVRLIPSVFLPDPGYWPGMFRFTDILAVAEKFDMVVVCIVFAGMELCLDRPLMEAPSGLDRPGAGEILSGT